VDSTKFQKDLFSNRKNEKKIFGNFFVIFPNKFFSETLCKFPSSLKIENKHIEVENQFLFNLQRLLVAFQWLYLPSGLYNLISFPVRNTPTQLTPEISLNPLRKAESPLNFCISCAKSGINFNQFHYSLKSMFKKILLSREIE